MKYERRYERLRILNKNGRVIGGKYISSGRDERLGFEINQERIKIICCGETFLWKHLGLAGSESK